MVSSAWLSDLQISRAQLKNLLKMDDKTLSDLSGMDYDDFSDYVTHLQYEYNSWTDVIRGAMKESKASEYTGDFWWGKHVTWESGFDQDFLYCNHCNRDMYAPASHWEPLNSISDDKMNRFMINHLKTHHGITEPVVTFAGTTESKASESDGMQVDWWDSLSQDERSNWMNSFSMTPTDGSIYMDNYDEMDSSNQYYVKNLFKFVKDDMDNDLLGRNHDILEEAHEGLIDNIWGLLVNSSRMQFLDEYMGDMNIPLMITMGSMSMPQTNEEVADALGVSKSEALKFISKWAYDNGITDTVYTESKANEGIDCMMGGKHKPIDSPNQMYPYESCTKCGDNIQNIKGEWTNIDYKERQNHANMKDKKDFDRKLDSFNLDSRESSGIPSEDLESTHDLDNLFIEWNKDFDGSRQEFMVYADSKGFDAEQAGGIYDIQYVGETNESWSQKSSIDRIEALEKLGIKQGDAVKLSGLEFEDFGEDLQGALKGEVEEGDVEDARKQMQYDKWLSDTIEKDSKYSKDDHGITDPHGLIGSAWQKGAEVENPNSEFGQNYPDYNNIGKSQTSRTKYECEYCDHGFKSNEALSIHHNDKHAIAPESLDGYASEADPDFQNDPDFQGYTKDEFGNKVKSHPSQYTASGWDQEKKERMNARGDVDGSEFYASEYGGGSPMNDTFHNWLDQCPVNWYRESIDDNSATYRFVEDEYEKEGGYASPMSDYFHDWLDKCPTNNWHRQEIGSNYATYLFIEDEYYTESKASEARKLNARQKKLIEEWVGSMSSPPMVITSDDLPYSLLSELRDINDFDGFESAIMRYASDLGNKQSMQGSNPYMHSSNYGSFESKANETISEDEKDEIFQYLFDLQESGATNMFGSGAYVERDFPHLDKREVGDVITEWMANWDEIATRMGIESYATENPTSDGYSWSADQDEISRIQFQTNLTKEEKNREIQKIEKRQQEQEDLELEADTPRNRTGYFESKETEHDDLDGHQISDRYSNTYIRFVQRWKQEHPDWKQNVDKTLSNFVKYMVKMGYNKRNAEMVWNDYLYSPESKATEGKVKSYCNICGYDTWRNEGEDCPYHQRVLSDGTFLWDEFNQDGEGYDKYGNRHNETCPNCGNTEAPFLINDEFCNNCYVKPPESKWEKYDRYMSYGVSDADARSDIFTEAGLEDHSCPECGFITSDNSDYVDHLNAHEE